MANPKILNFEGYVIHLSPFKESDAMVKVLTENGLMSFLAHGVNKPTSKLASSCTLLAFSKFSLSEGKNGSYTLKEAENLTSVDGKDSLERLACFSFIAELSHKLVQDDEGKASFPWLKRALEAIANGFDPLSASSLYIAHLLKICGYGLDVDECVYCQKKTDIAGISYSEGGFVCKDDLSEGGKQLSPRELKIIRYVFKSGLEDFERVSFEKKENLDLISSLSRYLDDLTGVELKSLFLLMRS